MESHFASYLQEYYNIFWGYKENGLRKIVGEVTYTFIFYKGYIQQLTDNNPKPDTFCTNPRINVNSVLMCFV